MKKCSYCGKEFPDEAKACDIDGTPFDAPSLASDDSRRAMKDPVQEFVIRRARMRELKENNPSRYWLALGARVLGWVAVIFGGAIVLCFLMASTHAIQIEDSSTWAVWAFALLAIGVVFFAIASFLTKGIAVASATPSLADSAAKSASQPAPRDVSAIFTEPTLKPLVLPPQVLQTSQSQARPATDGRKAHVTGWVVAGVIVFPAALSGQIGFIEAGTLGMLGYGGAYGLARLFLSLRRKRG